MSFDLVWRCHKHNRTFKFGNKCPNGRDKCAQQWALYNEVETTQLEKEKQRDV